MIETAYITFFSQRKIIEKDRDQIGAVSEGLVTSRENEKR
jgi:hypothetical protein